MQNGKVTDEMYWKVVETDNFGSDYPNEKFVEHLPTMNDRQAEMLAYLINTFTRENSDRFWKAVPGNYQLQTGFEP